MSETPQFYHEDAYTTFDRPGDPPIIRPVDNDEITRQNDNVALDA